MNFKQIILASNSPRRKELLAGLDIDFTISVKPDIDETYPPNLAPREVPVYLARKKAQAYMDELDHQELLITADTVVIVGDEILGKPCDDDEAKRMLTLLSGKTHLVTTGVCLATLRKTRTFSVTTQVTFKELTADEINYYILKYRPFDKAGAYGIQEWIGYIGVTNLEGSFYNVMGLPVQRIYQEMQSF
ncbi:septum formation protein Maf [Prevotella sp. A2931]|uniref:dTTP/UTP pyrophosphatase n=1 Tax=Prevotella illustrans TaxID=2800387 RepID=A0ABS3M2V8_9BACT|nr:MULTISPECIES: Maf-like protein [Prevotella]MBO1362470.1 septum formation protein Maf [Prevotella illustrans]PTL25021.1 septum formation protein Maf [Prevotella sp. oral taxon 820]